MNQKVEVAYTLELGTNGRLVLPASIRKHLNYQAGDMFVLRVKEDGVLELRSGKDVASATRGVLKAMKTKKRGKRAKGA
jgi:AbrB family looped-hinge helix DNA binding protein